MVKTAQELKKAVNDPNRIKAAQNLFMAMAWAETVRPIVTGYKKAILKNHQWHIAKEWTDKGMPDEIVLDPEHTYLLEENDFTVYLAECNEERKKAGLYVKSDEYCPLLVADHDVTRAEWALFDAMKDITGIDGHELYGKNREKYLDLLLKMFAPFVEVSEKEKREYVGEAQYA